MIYIILTLFASAMWGSWMQVAKHLKKFPIPAFIMVLYTSSVLFVWLILLFFNKQFVPIGILNELSGKMDLAILVMFSGLFMALGMLISITNISKVGLILVTSISSITSTILGLIISLVVGGLPDSISPLYIFVALIVMLSAGFLSQYAGVLRDRDIKKISQDEIGSKKYIVYVILANVLVSMYVYGFSIGTRTALNPNGFAPLLCVGLLAIGSFFGALISTTILLYRSKQLNVYFKREYRKQVILGLGSGLFHYGGNVLNIMGIPFLSAPVSFLIGKTADFWSYLWGHVYGEFNGSSSRTMSFLYSGFLLYILSVFILIYGLYY